MNSAGGNGEGGSGGSGSNVDVNKKGLNDGDVTADINGNTENYTVRITDTDEAREMAEAALMAAYGTLDGLRYFPMDISLYDTAGNKVSPAPDGVTARINMRMPTDLQVYGGNVKAASTTGGQLEALNTSYTLVDDQPHAIFTAEHFSPYMLYVDTNNLTAGSIKDNTPTTGDPIHPKWFLSIGLAALSILLFLKKEPEKRVKKVKVA